MAILGCIPPRVKRVMKASELHSLWLYLCVLLLLSYCVVGGAADRREFQHGVNFVNAGEGAYWLLWSSSPGDPPQGKRTVILPDGGKCQYFTHDVYYSRVQASNPQVKARPLISLPEAQEPVSAASSAAGILVSFEDGSDSDISDDCHGVIQQRYQWFDHNMQAKSERHTVSVRGGHSGHVAAVGERFVIAYSEGWVQDDASDGLGTGKTVLVDVVNKNGKWQNHRPIAAEPRSRNWWPLVAGSSNYALIIWQRFVSGSHRASLMYAVYDPATDRFIKPPTVLRNEVYYYHYDVQYLPTINRFVIAGNELGDMTRHTQRGAMKLKTQKGFMVLLDEQGAVVNHWSAGEVCELCAGYHTHPFVRESQPAMLAEENGVKLLYPVRPKGVLLFSVDSDAIALQRYVEGDNYWHSLGTDGIFLDANTAYFATLSPLGLRTLTISTE